MNTNNIKSFAKQARLILLDGVEQRLKFWGFNDDGSNDQSLESTHGGYIFRGQIYTDTSGAVKWNRLKKRLKDKQAVKDVKEEAAYTWFNRLMAIKILEANGYLPEQIGYAEGIRIPMVVQNAKRGHHSLSGKSDKSLLVEYLQEDKEEQAFGLLITDLCNRNKLLHDIFGRIDDYTEILLPQNLLQPGGLLDLINSDAIPAEDFKEVELIGWLYQFYIEDKKDDIEREFKAKNKKVRVEDIPADTQIFTPKWIVKYMVENTVGKIYFDYEPESQLKSQMKYLVENDSTIQQGNKANNHSSIIIHNLQELSLIDPASGSGHILVTGFELLFKMYREQGYTARQAVENILTHNLVGLDIDDRAMQLARFAVLLKAAAYDAEILEKGLMPRIYSFPEAVHFTNEEIQTFLGYDGHAYVADLKDTLNLLNQGKNIGSALKIDLSSEARNCLKDQYDKWLQKEKTAGLSLDELAIWSRLKSFLDVLLVLTQQYMAVVANPPYMGQKKMNGELKDYLSKNYPTTNSDLMTVFMEVIPNLTLEGSRFALINLPSWLFLSSYEKIREYYVDNYHFDSLIHMGRGIFGIDFGSVAYSIKKQNKENAVGTYFRLHERNFQHIYFEDIEKLFLFSNGNESYKYDFSQYRGEAGITEIPKEGTVKGIKLYYPNIYQSNLSKIPGSPIAYWVSENTTNHFVADKKIYDFFESGGRTKTHGNDKYIRFFWETSMLKIGRTQAWLFVENGGDARKWYGNKCNIINWTIDARNFYESHGGLSNPKYWEKEGLTWAIISSTGSSFRYKDSNSEYTSASPTLMQKSSISIYYALAFLNTKYVFNLLKVLNPTVNTTSGDVRSLPIIFSELKKEIIESRCITNIEYSQKDWDSRETSWDFVKSPLVNEEPNLKKAYKLWQDSVTNDFFQLHANEEELNRIFINIYGLQDELTPEVALKDITILQDELDRNALEQLEPVFREQGKDAIALPIRKDEVISQFISYCIGVFLGRYRLDKPGLNIAHPAASDEELATYQYNGHTITIDEDGILPLMGENCAFPDDALAQVKELMLALWGEKNLIGNINFVHECLGGMDLHKWLTEKFWSYHTGMYKKKPIYWLFSSNPGKPQNAAFKVLVYMHRMDKYTVQNIQRHYLHPHQEYIRNEKDKLKENEDSLSKLEQKRLEMLLNWELECRDYNEVLKELARLQIEFDLDDGVDVNYLKFKGAVAVI